MTGLLPSAGLAPKMAGLLLGCLLLALMVRALRTGSAPLIYRQVNRHDAPALYWTGVTIAAIGGVALIVVAVFARLQRL